MTIKHFAFNNQEANRFGSNSVVSERAAREIYLKGFEITVKKSAPMFVMSSYNQVNGASTFQHYGLLTEILRNEWGFDGFVMSDWYSVFGVKEGSMYYGQNIRAVMMRAGNDCEMPGKNEAQVLKGLEDGEMRLGDLQKSAINMLNVIKRTKVFDTMNGKLINSDAAKAAEAAQKAQKEAEENYAKDYKAWEDAMAAYDESLKIDLEKSEAAANAAIKKYNGLKPEDRKKEANIDAVATALVAYYKDALAKEAQVTKATATKGSDTKKISAWLIADADNFKKVVGVDLGFIIWDAGDIATANEISKENIGKLIDVEQDSSVKTPLEKWKSASSAVFSDNFNSGNNPRRLPVSKDEVIAAAGGNHVDALKNGNYGSLGKMIWATAETASLQAIIDQVETYKALKEAFTAQKAVEQAAQDKANAALADAVDKAKKANDEAQAAYDKVFKEVNDNIETVQKEYGNNEIIKGKIETEITVYLNNNFTNGDLGSLEAIKNLVKEEYMIALANVTAAKADVAKAKRNIEKLAAGTYTDTDYITESLASIQENIKVKQAEYDAAKADYDAASAQLKALLAIFLK